METTEKKVIAFIVIVISVATLGLGNLFYTSSKDLPYNLLKWKEAKAANKKAADEEKLVKTERQRQSEEAGKLRDAMYEKASMKNNIHGLSFEEMGWLLMDIGMTHIEINEGHSCIRITHSESDPEIYIVKSWLKNKGYGGSTKLMEKKFKIPREEIHLYLGIPMPEKNYPFEEHLN